MSHAISPTIQDKFAKLADFLEQASKLAREISQHERNTLISVPELKRPAHVPPDEEWFWSDEWQAGEREANEDIKAGRISRVYTNADELLADLQRPV